MAALGREAVEAVLRRHVLEAWFPRCLDHTHGGFLCDFDRRWSSRGPDEKLLEFQARQTLTAADAFRAFPAETGLRDAALHGFRYLREVLWDREAGGWFHRLDRGGKPLEAETKHAHGAAYAIEACAAVYRATGEAAALDLAREGFHWLDRYAHDQQYGGYFGFLHRDGRVIRTASDSPLPTEVDTIGTEIGLKDANVHSDLIETFVELYRVWPDTRVLERLNELLRLVSERMLVRELGALHIFVTADWTPVPQLARAAYQCQTAYRFTSAREFAGDPAALGELACRMVDHALRHARDPRGGVYYAMPATPPTELHRQNLLVVNKSWWAQAEALKALFAVSRLVPERQDYLRALETQWAYLNAFCLDARHGGFFESALDVVRPSQRLFGARFAPDWVTQKGSPWKDASHEGRALLYCVEGLRTSP